MADAQDQEGSFGFFPDRPGDLGDVDRAEDLEGADGEVAERGHGAGRGPGMNGRGVLAEGDVSDVVAGVLDAPLTADERGDLGGCGLVRVEAGHGVAGPADLGLPGFLAAAVEPDRKLRVGKGDAAELKIRKLMQKSRSGEVVFSLPWLPTVSGSGLVDSLRL
ncbi:hypothetical protein [Glycomyces sp. YM15]|uniref:hypothetical protein n=1 Tax=Glycomyces sp. YM15 TaxID=2800446 RepID=UPI001964302C|nr:hypothetical protein [Glycomyces sp. YM15]